MARSVFPAVGSVRWLSWAVPLVAPSGRCSSVGLRPSVPPFLSPAPVGLGGGLFSHAAPLRESFCSTCGQEC